MFVGDLAMLLASAAAVTVAAPVQHRRSSTPDVPEDLMVGREASAEPQGTSMFVSGDADPSKSSLLPPPPPPTWPYDGKFDGVADPLESCGDQLVAGSVDAPGNHDCFLAAEMWSDALYWPTNGRQTQVSGSCVAAWHPVPTDDTTVSVTGMEIQDAFKSVVTACPTGATGEFVSNYAYSGGPIGTMSMYWIESEEDYTGDVIV